METTMDDEGTAVNGAGTTTVHDVHMRGLSEKHIEKDIGSSMSSRMYVAPEVYELERRVIFSKRWFLVSHKARYRNVGDFVLYEMAGFSFVVVRNKEQRLVRFHNICRHRAFPVVQKGSGTAKTFSCQYHGWSYSLDGKLAKAPRFDSSSVPAFDKSARSLCPIHVHVDRNGFVYVNLDAKEIPNVTWESQYADMDKQDSLASSSIDWNGVEYDFIWTKEGRFNWKLMQDNYNECYHCLTAHPDVARTTSLDTYYVIPGTPGNFISHFSEPKQSNHSAFDETRFAGRSATHVFPVGHFSPNPGTGFMHLMRTVPTSATTTRQEYDVYKLNTPHATPEAHQRMIDFYGKVIQEDIELCNAVQTNLGRGVYTSGPLHPFHEEGVLAFQGMVTGMLAGHLEEERKAGKQIWPAQRAQDQIGQTDETCERILLCASRSGLEW